MITEIKTLPTENLQLFMERVSAGLQSFTRSDSNEIVVFKKVFDPNTGVQLADECIAAVPMQSLSDEIANCLLRVSLIEKFLGDNA